MKIQILFVLIVFIALLAILHIQTVMSNTIWSSPLQQFSVEPDKIFLNWTNNYSSNITINLNEGVFNQATTVRIFNDTGFTENYTQGNSNSLCQYTYNKLQVESNGTYNNTALFPSSQTKVALIYKNLDCKPGKYYIPILSIRNASYPDVIEQANISVIVDIPINAPSSYFSNMTGIGYFEGYIPANSTYYHSYYFDSGSVQNATGIEVTLSGWTLPKSLDLFLFDNITFVNWNPTLKAKAIDISDSKSLLSNLNYPSVWEIRIYGNYTSSTSYSGGIYFTTLNITNTSAPEQQINYIDFGVRNATTSFNLTNITLKNEGNISLTNVVETKEIYHVQEFDGSGQRDFTFLVPGSGIVSKVKVSLSWTGDSNYSFNLYNQNNVSVAYSANKHLFANFTNVMQEEYDETTSIPDTAGMWKIEVKNNTANVSNTYTIKVFIYPSSASDWINTNYSTMTFVNRDNSSDVRINLTVPSTSLNGSYEGYIQYTDNRGAGIRIPINFGVTTPILVVDNTMSSTTRTIDENYGTNLTRTLYFNVSNLGFYDLNVSFLDSVNLTCTSTSTCNGYNASLSFNTTSIVLNNSWDLIQVNVTFNSSIPVGTYEGWIKINGTNDPIINSHPYTNFTINIKLNLTNLLDIKIYTSTTPDGNNVVGNSTGSVVAENVTHQVKIFYINGTEIEASNALNTSNFTFWLIEKNVSYRIPSTSGLTLYNGTQPLYIGGYYNINSTISDGQPGGRYEVHASSNWYRSDGKYFSGGGINGSTLIINNTGLHMSTEKSSTVYLNNGTNYTYTVNISNYGPLRATSATINLTEPCSGWSVENGGSDCGGASYSSSKFTFSLSGMSTKSCQVWWNIRAGGSESGGCWGYIIGDSTSNKWFNPSGINVSVAVSMYPTPVNTTDSTQQTTTTSNTTTTGQALKYMNITSYTSLIQIAQGNSSTITVTVKNTNTTRPQDIKLAVENLTSSWFNVTPTLISVAALNSTTFTVRFNIPSTAEIKTYNALFKAISNYVNVSKSFVLKVLPSESTKNEIMQTLASYRNNMTQLSLEINNTKDQGKNVSLAEDKLLELRTIIDQAETYTDQNNYFDANQLLSSIQQLIDATKDEITKAQTGATTNGSETGAPTIFGLQTWMILVIVGVVVSVAAFLAFMFWPKGKAIFSKKGMPTIKIKEFFGKPKDIVKPQEENPWVKLKEKWANIKKEKKTGTQ